MENFMNPTETNEGISASGELTRITFNLKNRKVSSTSFPNGVDSELARYVNHIDFPAINEAYRGKEVKTPHYLDIMFVSTYTYICSIVLSMDGVAMITLESV